MWNLEIQVGQIAKTVSEKQRGGLPSDTVNPKDKRKEKVKAITFRSGTQLVEPKVSKRQPTQDKYLRLENLRLARE